MADRMMCEMQLPFHVLLFTPPDVINPLNSSVPFDPKTTVMHAEVGVYRLSITTHYRQWSDRSDSMADGICYVGQRSDLDWVAHHSCALGYRGVQRDGSLIISCSAICLVLLVASVNKQRDLDFQHLLQLKLF